MTWLPERVYLTDHPHVTVARPTLAIVAYVDDALAWSCTHAAALAETFGQTVDVSRMQWFMTSRLSHWRRVDPQRVSELTDHLRADPLFGRVRHLLRFRWADDCGAPSYEFSYREVDPQLSERLGYVRISMPVDAPLDRLVRLTAVLSDLPVWCVTAGYMPSVNPLYVPESYGSVLAWARRCHGLHVPAPDIFGPSVRSGMPGLGWLNFISAKAAAAWRIDVPATLASATARGLDVSEKHGGLWLRAGDEPELGDANALQPAEHLGRLAQLMAPHLIAEPPALPAPFGDAVADWMMRFTFPEQWT
ncbi:MAG: hypothetical protein R3B40_29380 [Polyangiales bacterium]|nr:hypothetical protein [Myxococcales bacterium]